MSKRELVLGQFFFYGHEPLYRSLLMIIPLGQVKVMEQQIGSER